MYLTRHDLPFVLSVVALYLALASLCLWGAIAWNSLFMLCLSGLWFFIGFLFFGYVTFTPPVEDEEDW